MTKKTRTPVLAKFTDEEIQAEIKRRADEAAHQKQRAHEAQHSRQAEIEAQIISDLTDEVNDADIEIIIPDHERTSCSDTEVYNGWNTRSDGGPRCKRCALLQSLEGSAMRVVLVVEFRERK